MFSASALISGSGSIRQMTAVAFSMFGMLSLASMVGCSHDAPSGGGPLVVPLSYAPEHAKEDIKRYPGTAPEDRIFVGRFEDKRDKTDAIGVNVEHSNPVQVVSGTDPVEFFRQTLASQLKNAGLHVVDDPSQADRIINGDLTRFWVEESNSYQADVAATIRVSDKSGIAKWQGMVSGKGETFGRSLSPENYRQAISDAMVRLTYDNLIVLPEFQNAVK
jgi:hypothetical protein